MAREPEDDEEEDEEDRIELIMFKGPLNGVEPNMRQNTRLVEAGLMPAKKLVTDAVSRRAETIVVEPRGNAASVKLEVDGIGYPGARLGKQHALAITQVLKLLAGLDVKERKRPQHDGLRAELEGTKYELMVGTEPLAGGAERLTIRIRGTNSDLEKPEAIGFSKELKQRIRDLTSDRSGLLLACGPPHSGVTTTAQSGVLRSIDIYVYSVVALANMGAREVTNIPPFEVEEGDDVAASLARIIRAEHDVVFVDPIRDAESLKVLCQYAEEIAIVGEMTARDAATAIVQLVQWIGPEMVCRHVRGLVTQRLVRRLCPKCKFAYRPHPKLLAKIGLPKDVRVLYKPQPEPDPEEVEEEEPPVCRRCGGLNYMGRVGMFELLEVTDKVKEAIMAGADPNEIRKAAREEDQMTLQKDGIRLVQEGVTSLEELQRIFKPAKPGKKKVKRRRPE